MLISVGTLRKYLRLQMDINAIERRISEKEVHQVCYYFSEKFSYYTRH